MATILERVPLDDINTRAREVDVGRSLLTLVAAVFFAVGWFAGKVALGVAWCAVAVKVGWVEARKGPVRPEVAGSG